MGDGLDFLQNTSLMLINQLRMCWTTNADIRSCTHICVVVESSCKPWGKFALLSGVVPHSPVCLQNTGGSKAQWGNMCSLSVHYTTNSSCIHIRCVICAFYEQNVAHTKCLEERRKMKESHCNILNGKCHREVFSSECIRCSEAHACT